MAVGVREIVSGVNNGSSEGNPGTVEVTTTSTASDDLLVLVQQVNGGSIADIESPSPGTWDLAGTDGDTNSLHTKVWTRAAGSSGNLTITANHAGTGFSASQQHVHLFVLTGADTADPVPSGGFAADAGFGSSQDAPSATGVTDGLKICSWISDDVVNYSSGMTGDEETDATSSTCYSGYEATASDGATGTETATASASKTYTSVTVTVAPASGSLEITPAAVTVTATPGSLSMSVDLAPAATTVTATPGSLTITIDVPLTAAAVAVTPGAVTVTQGLTVAPDPATVTATPGTLTVAAGAVDITPAAVTITAAPGSLTLAVGLTPAPVTVTATPGSLTVSPGAVNITPAAVTITVAPGTLTVSVVSASITPAAVALTVTPGTVTVRGSARPGWGRVVTRHDLAAAAELERQRSRLVCPNDGTSLRTSPDGELFCPFDGYRPDRGW